MQKRYIEMVVGRAIISGSNQKKISQTVALSSLTRPKCLNIISRNVHASRKYPYGGNDNNTIWNINCVTLVRKLRIMQAFKYPPVWPFIVSEVAIGTTGEYSIRPR